VSRRTVASPTPQGGGGGGGLSKSKSVGAIPKMMEVGGKKKSEKGKMGKRKKKIWVIDLKYRLRNFSHSFIQYLILILI
jgi:hypothetical protein